MSNIPDNYELFQVHDSEQEELLEQRPVCICCGEHIQDEFYYDIDGDTYCDRCLKDTFLRFI